MTSPTYTASSLAKLFGLSERRVTLLASEGIIPKATKSGYDIVACVQAYVRYLENDAFIVNAEGLADFLNLSTAMIYKLSKQGMPRLKRGKYDIKECARWYIESFRGKLEGGETSDVQDERRRLLAQQRRKATIEADLLEGQQIPIDKAAADITKIAGITASQLEALPGRLAYEVVNIQDPGEARQILLKECRKIREQIANAIREYAQTVT